MKQGVKNIGCNKMFSLASMATMATCIFVFGIFFSIILNFQNIVKQAEESVAITVFFEKNASQEKIDAIGEALKSREDVKEVNYISADEAWESFQVEYFGEDAGELAEGFKNDNPLAGSDSYEVYMKSVESQADLVKYAEGLDGVRQVNKSEIVAKTLNSINKLLWYASIVIIGILLAVSVFLINNAVTMGVAVRREEIAIMKYIGAKDSFVRMPFVFEGVIIGFIGAAVPLVAFYFIYDKVIQYVLEKFTLLRNILTFLPVNQVYQTLLPIGLLLGIGIGFLGSYVTIRKHLKV